MVSLERLVLSFMSNLITLESLSCDFTIELSHSVFDAFDLQDAVV